MTTIVNYGAGNLRSVQNTFEELGAKHRVTNEASDVEEASKIVLPGVGHFGQMMQALDDLKLRSILIQKIQRGIPFLGICVGLQCLFEESEESPGSPGLGIFHGTVKRFPGALRVPHMGWNSLEPIRQSRLLRGIPANAFTYFAHSYYAPVMEATAATCTYARPYSAVLEDANLFAVQFHPEKSSVIGLQVLKNFVDLPC